jgi:hypothetical protein
MLLSEAFSLSTNAILVEPLPNTARERRDVMEEGKGRGHRNRVTSQKDAYP